MGSFWLRQFQKCDGLTWVGARDTCVSKKSPENRYCPAYTNEVKIKKSGRMAFVCVRENAVKWHKLANTWLDQVGARVEPARIEASGGIGVVPAGDLEHWGQAHRVLPPILAGDNTKVAISITDAS